MLREEIELQRKKETKYSRIEIHSPKTTNDISTYILDSSKLGHVELTNDVMLEGEINNLVNIVENYIGSKNTTRELKVLKTKRLRNHSRIIT